MVQKASLWKDSVSAPRQSQAALNAANFFLADATAVVIPFLEVFLRARGWGYDAIMAAVAVAGLGVFVLQTPAGYIVDRVRARRAWLAGASLLLGGCLGLLPLVPARWFWIDPLLFLAGASQSFFTPLLGALALALAGHARLSRLLGMNQASNHLGNIAAALGAMLLVSWFGLFSVFSAVVVLSVLAAVSAFLIRQGDLDERRASGGCISETECTGLAGLRELIRDRRVVVLFLAPAPVLQGIPGRAGAQRVSNGDSRRSGLPKRTGPSEKRSGRGTVRTQG
jgi:MFS family permease